MFNYKYLLLIDYINDKYVQDRYAKQPKSSLDDPLRYESNELDLPKIVDAICMHLYRRDIAYAWFLDCKVYVDSKMPQIGVDHPMGTYRCLTIEPGHDGREWKAGLHQVSCKGAYNARF